MEYFSEEYQANILLSGDPAIKELNQAINYGNKNPGKVDIYIKENARKLCKKLGVHISDEFSLIQRIFEYFKFNMDDINYILDEEILYDFRVSI